MQHDRSIRLFGRVAARSGENEVSEFTTVQARGLLVYLAMHPDIDHPRDRLIEAIWPGRLDGSARNRLSVTLYHVKRLLSEVDPGFEPVFVSGRTTVRFDSSIVLVDLHEFRRHIAVARTSRDTEERRERYGAALGFYKGPLAPDIVTEWTLARQLEASQMFQEAAVWLATDLDSAGRSDDAQALLSASLDVEPYSERATELLTTWFTRSGKYEAALACAKRLRRAMSSYGQVPSRAILDRIEELSLILADRAQPTAVEDESVLTLLAASGAQRSTMENVVREHGGTYSTDGDYGVFVNPLVAMEAGSRLVQRSPDVRALVHTTIMAPDDPAPPALADGLESLPRRGLYGSDAFASLVRERTTGAVKRVAGSHKVWEVV